MTDRIHALTVVLEKDFRDDDCQHIIDAIKMIRHVVSVEAHVSDLDTHTAYVRARADLGERLFRVLHPEYEVREKG
jgi:hypothetical protein